jgi:putative transposase
LEDRIMAWRVESVMDQRLCFIAACLRADEPMSGLCLRFGISRKTGYKWLSRYRDFGAAGLVDLSSARHTLSPAMDPAITDAVVALRKQRPTWGPRKLLARLSLDRPEIVWPACSTIGDFLHREGLSKPRSRRARDPSRKQPEIEALAANDSWSADFKGWFRTGDGVRCEPLTVTDNYSRYLLACTAVPQITAAHVRPILTGLFRSHGLPRAFRTDNGSPFASRTGLGGLAQLSVWLLKLNIWPDRIAPGQPGQNGRHERMHRTLDEDVARPPAATIAEQQADFDVWREDFNAIRPHEALGQRCPAEFYVRSPRCFPEKIAVWEYPADHQVRRVSSDGYIKWRDGKLYLSEALRKETIALAQRDDGNWAIRFRNFDLGTLTDEGNEIRRSGLVRLSQARPQAAL